MSNYRVKSKIEIAGREGENLSLELKNKMCHIKYETLSGVQKLEMPQDLMEFLSKQYLDWEI